MGLLRAPAAILGVHNQQLGLGSTDFAIDGADDRQAFRFMVNADKTLSSLTVFADSVSGSPTGGCEIFATGADGNPTGAALADSTTHTPSPIVNGQVSFTGYSLALTGGEWYCAVLRNTHATPASNSYRSPVPNSGGIPLFGMGYGALQNWSVMTSTDAGSAWSGLVVGSTNLSLVFDDASTVGWPYRGQWNTGATDGVFGAREIGNRLTTPAGATLRAIGITFHTRSITGTPTGSLRGRIRLASDNSLLGTTYDTSPLVSISGNGRCALHFEDVVELLPSTAYDFLVGETTQSDTSGNRYNFEGTTIPTGGAATLPGSINKVYFDGTSWAETDTQVVHLGVLLDEQLSVAGGAGGGGAPRTLFIGSGVR